MVSFGFTLSSEEVAPTELVRLGRQAELSGFDFLTISDHFHPWVPTQGNSPHVWSVLGALAIATDQIAMGTAVTCPTIRQHPAIVAHAAATMSMLLPGRFFLGVGTGENLNEHVVGHPWPPPAERIAMLSEALRLMRALWEGQEVSERTLHYHVDRAKLYSLPPEPPPVCVAAATERAAELAGRSGDGLIVTAPDPKLVQAFADAGGVDEPVYGQVTICHGPDRSAAENMALEWWPNTSVPGDLGLELATPEQFAAVAELITTEDVSTRVVCGPDLEPIADRVELFIEAGVDHVFIHQVGPRQRPFLEVAGQELLPMLRERWPAEVMPRAV